MSAVEQDDRSDELQPTPSQDAAVSILTYGDPIRSWATAVAAVVDEAKVTLDEDGLHCRARDRANVAMVDLTAHAAGFEEFDVREPVTFGLILSRFEDAAGWARKRGADGDPVSIEVFEDPARMRVSVTRPDQQMKRISEWFGILTDSLRDRPDVPDLTLPNRATPGVTPFHEAVRALTTAQRHAHITRDGSTLVVASDPSASTLPEREGPRDEAFEDAVFLPNCAWDTRDAADEAEADSSMFSTDYLDLLVPPLKRSKADRVTVKWGDQHPVILQFEHEEWGFEGRYLLAPRLGPEE